MLSFDGILQILCRHLFSDANTYHIGYLYPLKKKMYITNPFIPGPHFTKFVIAIYIIIINDSFNYMLKSISKWILVINIHNIFWAVSGC